MGQSENLDELGKAPDRLRNHKLSLTCVCIDSKSRHAFTASKDGSIIKWNLSDRKIVAKVNSWTKNAQEIDKSLQEKRHTRHINCIAISHDDKYLATGGWDRKILIWSPGNLDWIHSFKMHRQEITALVFRENYYTLYSGSADRSVMIWSLEDEDNFCFVEALYGHESTVTSLDSSKRERVLSAGGRDESIRIWKIVEQAQTVFQSKHESVDVAKFIDDKTFISAGEDGSISVWTTQKRSPLCSIRKAHQIRTEGCDQLLSHDQKFQNHWITALATLPLENSKKVCEHRDKRQKFDDDPRTEDDDEQQAKDAESDHESDRSIDAGEDDQDSCESQAIALVASGSSDSKIRLWRLAKASGKYQLLADRTFDSPGFVNDLKFTTDGKSLIAACGQEHKFGRWWRLKTAKNCLRIFDMSN